MFTFLNLNKVRSKQGNFRRQYYIIVCRWALIYQLKTGHIVCIATKFLKNIFAGVRTMNGSLSFIIEAFAFAFDTKNALHCLRCGSWQGYDRGLYNSFYIFSYQKTILYVNGYNVSFCNCHYHTFSLETKGNIIVYYLRSKRWFSSVKGNN